MAQQTKMTVVALAAAGLGALASYAWFAQQRPLASVEAAPARPAPKPGGGPPGGFAVGVEAVPAALIEVRDALTAVGTVKSNESVMLRAEIAGRIAALDFREGSPVRKGEVLVTLDDSTQAAELRQAQANLALAQANFRRADELYARKFIAERARDETAANLKVSEAAVQLAQARVAKTRLRAPFSGVVGIRNVSVGDYVKEGQDLVNLEDIATLKVDFRLPEAAAAQARVGQSVEFAADALPERRFQARVDAIDPLLDAAGRALLLRARLANPDARLRPGMFVRVALRVGEARRALVVPEEALVPGGGEQAVFRVREGKAERVVVTTGARHDTRVEILDGLAEGDLVVTAGQLKIRDGAAVQLAQSGHGPPAGAARPAAK